MSEWLNSRVRICYEHGNVKTGRKIYEAQQLCHCENCLNRFNWKKEPLNCITTSTFDIEKVEEMLLFLDNWTCKDGKRQLETEYISF